MRHASTDALLAFIEASPSPYHAVAEAARLLKAAGFRQLDEENLWSLQPGDSAYVIRSGSLIAFRVGAQASAFRAVGAHTDSPCLKLKPLGARSAANYRQWGVEVYGGALWNSWLDRDLHLAGRLTVLHQGALSSVLVRLDDRRLRVPQLAIHLDRKANEGLTLNPQLHLVPILGLEGGRDLEAALREAASLPADAQIAAFDLFLHDAQPACYGGGAEEFIYAPRLDNLAMSHASLSALLDSAPLPGFVTIAAIFDHEEVGSTSAHGACSNFLPALLERLALALGWDRQEYLSALRRSFFISADMAHALHPNYMEKHEPEHKPLIGKGPVIKMNANQRYATDADTAGFFSLLCQRVGASPQYFTARNDCPCGSTIGPAISAKLGIPTVDVGNPMLSMHSAREMAGADDHPVMIRVFSSFFSTP